MADIDHNALFGPDTGAQPGVTMGGSGAPVDMDALFGTSPPVKTGVIADLTAAQSSVGRVLHAFGAGAQDAWGSAPLAETPVQDFLRKNGGWDDYAQKQGGVLKGFNEAVLRPLAASLDRNITGPVALGGRILGAGTEGTEGALAQGAQETKGVPYAGPVLSTALGGTGEFLEYGTQTAAPEMQFMHDLSTAAKTVNLSKARATAVIGEGEEGFFNTVPPNEQQVAQRTEAATESGVPVQQAIAPKPVPTLDELARKVDPETFTQYDEFTRQRQEALDRFNELADAHSQTPEAAAAQAKIDAIMGKVNGVESRLTGAARARLAAAQDELETVLKARTPEMDAINAQRTEASYQMQRLYGPVQDAYDHAKTLLPDAERMAQAGFDVGLSPVEGYLPEEQIAQAESPALDTHENAIDTHVARVAPDLHEDMANEGIATRAEQTPVGPSAESVVATGRGPAPGKAGEIPGGSGGETAAAGEPGIAGADLEPTRRTSFAPEHRVAPELEPRITQGTGEAKPFGLSVSIEAKAIEKGLVASFGDDVPMRNRVDFADQAQKISALMSSDQNAVLEMIRGQRPVPLDVVPQLLANAVEDHAFATGDVQLMRDLANSPIAQNLSESGLALRAARERQDFSVSNAIRDVQNARAGHEMSGALGKTEAAVKDVQAAKTAIRKLTSADKLLDFVKSIQCEV